MTNPSPRWPLLMAMILVATACISVVTPERPPGVPDDATWVGGVDGGAWILCESSGESKRYNCSVFNEHTGHTEARGTWVVRLAQASGAAGEIGYVEYLPELEGLDYQFWDGHRIGLRRQLVLLPDGWIDYPFPDGDGKRQHFVAGVPSHKAIQYQTVLTDCTKEKADEWKELAATIGVWPFEDVMPVSPEDLDSSVRSLVLSQTSEWAVTNCYLPCAFEMCAAILSGPNDALEVWVLPKAREKGAIMPEAHVVFRRSPVEIVETRKVHSGCFEYAQVIGWPRETCGLLRTTNH